MIQGKGRLNVVGGMIWWGQRFFFWHTLEFVLGLVDHYNSKISN